jgi:hypothetical protein
MSSFNCLADCCPPTPPAECCLELSDISTLFPNGASVVAGGVTFTFSPGGWYKEGCCLWNTTATLSGNGTSYQCTSDWTYQASESVKCTIQAMKKKTVTTSFDLEEGLPDLCPLNECPDIFVATQTTGSVTEKGERVVASAVKPIYATMVVGKYFRTCGYGETVCTYVVGITITYAVYSAGITQGYKTFSRTLDAVHPDILTYCMDGMTLAQAQAAHNISVIQGTNNFPLCNYIPDITTNPPQELVAVSRVKLLTNWNCPLVFDATDADPNFCNVVLFCMDGSVEQGPITITFNRTLPPIYVAKDYYAITNEELFACCRTNILNTFPSPKVMYEIIGPDVIPIGDTWSINPPPAGQQNIDDCIEGVNCITSLAACFVPAFGCYIPFPENTVFGLVIQCCANPELGPVADIQYHSRYYADPTFSYTNTTGNTPIVHTYNIPAWTLNC